MPLQNRVNPFGEIVAAAARGTFTGNRGIIHDPATRTLLARRWSSRAWLICRCAFEGRRRVVMGGRSWTELFFLDEATGLAAGHRPCHYCRRDAALAFRDAWARGNGGARPATPAMDAILHRERLDGREKRLHKLPVPATALPDGTMLADADGALLIAAGQPFRWSFDGYAPTRIVGEIALLTPPSTLRALASGYRPELHPGIGNAQRRFSR